MGDKHGLFELLHLNVAVYFKYISSEKEEKVGRGTGTWVKEKKRERAEGDKSSGVDR